MANALEARSVDVQRLLERAKTGAPEALGKLVELYQQPVRIYLARLVRRPEVADDLAQEVFLTAFRSLGDHTAGRPVLPWLMGIARHRALHHLRCESRRQQREGRNLDAVSRLALAEASAPVNQRICQMNSGIAGLREETAGQAAWFRAFYFRIKRPRIGVGWAASSIRMLLLRAVGLAECMQNYVGHR